ncbi:hypothetical protein FE257_012000 [Aspergillus nanangensis]|uniref:Uncharacterized protein n=1 Tax=Aspergillus nanangensis TaxID=2582783 RepID=A0AAD4CGS0_ASPNN|nr:hypothetical protein FE257_012000 [Aspergillus nanangensis]
MSSIVSLLSSWGASASTTQILNEFASPPTHTRPYIRWWWPHGLVEIDEIRREVSQIADAGFGGIEIQDVHNSIEAGTDIESHSHGWATEPWINAVHAALDEANAHGLAHDMALGPCWPVGVPTYGPDDEPAAKEIVLGKEFVVAGNKYDGPVPPPFQEPNDNVNEQALYAVQAWRVSDASTNVTAIPVYLEYGSMIDLAEDVTGGSVSFTPPDDATWLIFSTYVRGSGQQPEGYPHTDPLTYVVDHFSQAGVQPVFDYWEEHLLSEEFLSLISKTPTTFMEDSIELEQVSYWTPGLPAKFEARHGYDVRTILPIVTQYEDEEFLFEFADAESTRAALNDFYDLLGQLYRENHLQPMKSWANNLGVQYRIQPYGIPQMDGIQSAAEVDIPEGESLGFGAVDNYRSLAGAAVMANLSRVSNELGAYSHAAYATTWAKILATVNPEFVAGVSQNVLHGMSYLDAPGSVWPGFAAFTPIHGDEIGYAESWGPRQPAWLHAPDFTGYMGRVQYILQRGVGTHDCAFLRQNGDVDSDYIPPYFTSEGAGVGWSTVFIDEALLNSSAASVRGGRLAPETGNFSLVAIEADPFGNGQAILTESAADTLYGFAKAGLSILMVGDWESPRSYSLGANSSSASIAETVKRLLELDNVVNVAGPDEVPAGLQRLGIAPVVEYDQSALIHTRRKDGDLDHYFFVSNSSSERVDQTVSIPTRHANVVPVQLDPWTGNATVLPVYSVADGRLHIPITLQPYQSSLISVVPLSGPNTQHAVNSTADSVIWEPGTGRLIVRTTDPGSVTTTLNNGETYKTTLDAALPELDLSNWELTVDDWQPADGDGTTGNITATKYVRHTLTLTSLTDWTAIEDLQDVSGNGTYSTTFTLGTTETPYSNRTGAYLALEKFNGSFRTKVNGISLPALDQMALQYDISQWLKNGSNSIEIEVATSLLNRMRIVQPDIYTPDRQAFGLLGVRIKPFSQAYLS